MIETMDQAHWKIEEMYAKNYFALLLEMRIVACADGKAEIAMPVKPRKHTNFRNFCHGGATAALMDTVMGLACRTLDKDIVTLQMSTNYYKVADEGELLTARAAVVHNGRKTMTADGEICNEAGERLMSGRGTFFVIKTFALAGCASDGGRD